MQILSELKMIAEGREAEIFEYGDGRVLRLFRDASASAWFEREVVAMRAVRSVTPLVPEVFETTEIDGRPGIIMERVAGIDLLTRIASKPWTVLRAGKILGETHARLHEVVAPPGIDSVHERGQALAERTTLVPPEMLAWALRELQDLPDGDRLLHGDFHPGNVLLSPSGPVVIDWPGVARGDPYADIARTVLTLRIGEVPPGSPFIVRQGARFVRGLLISGYLRAYGAHRRLDMDVLERWISVRAVDRMADNIVEEREALLAIIRRAMPSAPSR